MSQPKRYACLRQFGMLGAADGLWVEYEDYAALVQQGIRDHADWRSKLNFLEADYKSEIARLTTENERLRKAGDAFIGTYLFASVKGLVSQDIAAKVIQDWQAAKEGNEIK